jgi:hypothetical protein
MYVFEADISEADYPRMRALIPELPASYVGFCSERERRHRRRAKAGVTIRRERVIPDFFAQYARARKIASPTWDGLDVAAMLQWRSEHPIHHRTSAA